MKFIKYLLICLIISIPAKASHESYSLEELNGLKLKAKVNRCASFDTNACCFTDDVILYVSFDNEKINSFTFKGNQVGSLCPNSLTVYPTKFSSTQKQITVGQISATDLRGFYSYTFYTTNVEIENNQTLIQFQALIPSKKQVFYQDFEIIYQNGGSSSISFTNILKIKFTFVLFTFILIFIF